MKNNKNCGSRRRYEKGGFRNACVAIYTNGDSGNKFFIDLLKFAVQQGWEKTLCFSDPQENKCPTAGLDELLRNISQGHVDIVLLHQLSDVAASLDSLAAFFNHLAAKKVELISISENIDSRQLSSLALGAEILKAGFKFRKEQASRKTKEGLALARAQGIKLGRPDQSHLYQKKVEALCKRKFSTRAIRRKLHLSLPMAHKLVVKVRSQKRCLK